MLQTTSSNGTIRDIWNLPGKKGVWSARSVGEDLLDLKMGISEEKNTATLMQIYTFWYTFAKLISL